MITSTRRRTLVGIVAAVVCSLAPAAPAQAGFVGYTVNDLADTVSVTGADAVCDADAGMMGDQCTLREAIKEANATVGHDDILFSVTGTHTLTGQLTAIEPVTIDGNGSGAGGTVIDGTDAFRLFLLNGPAATFKDLRLQDGGIINPNGDGGAAIRTSNDLTLNNVTVTSNVITGAGDGFGAGIDVIGGTTLTVTNSTISDNTISSAGGNGGAGISSAAATNLTDTTVSGNQITAGTGTSGGGMNLSTDHNIVRSTISGNMVSASGGVGAGLFTGGGPGTRAITNSTISGNTATTGGGGALHLNSNQTMTNVTLANNSGGSGIMGQGDDLEVAGGTTTARNTIFASTDPCNEAGGTIASGTPGNNIDEGTTCGFTVGANDFNLNNTNAMLGALALNAPGTTMTHEIPFGSPAIDFADFAVPCSLATDQRGVTRPQGTRCDVGAFEREYRLFTAAKAGTGAGTVTGIGVNCGGDCMESVVDGTEIILTATAAAGSTFTSWTGCDTPAGNQCTQTVSGGNETATANFTANPVVTPPVTNPPVTTPQENPACAALRAKLKKAKSKRKKRKIRAQLKKLGC